MFIPQERGVIFVILVDRLPTNSTLQDAVQEELKGISKVAKLQQNLNITKQIPISISNHSAYEILVEYNQSYLTGYIRIRAMFVVTVVNRSKFIIDYTGVADRFTSNKQLADAMLDSIQITEPSER